MAKKQENLTLTPRFYYSDTFEALILENRAAIKRRLIDIPKKFREIHLAPNYNGKGRLSGNTAWMPLRHYLDALEAHLATLLSDHSPAYWLHLYRRIAPRLYKRHDNKTDRTTVVLVRSIAELAFLRHGKIEKNDDLGLINKTHASTFLDGHFLRVVGNKLGSKTKARKQYESFRRTRQSVMLEFSEDEFLRVHEVEGFAYEYWAATAAMRSIGKGSSVEWSSSDGWFRYDDQDVHPFLFAIYDWRINKGESYETSLGTWNQLGTKEEDTSRFYFASYNPFPEPIEVPMWNPIKRVAVSGQAAVNFLIGSSSLNNFETIHQFMQSEFEKHHSVKLEVVLFCVWCISFFGIFPEKLFFEKNAERKLETLLNCLINLHFRGYALIRLTIDEIAKEALWWSKAAGQQRQFTVEEVRRGFEFMFLTRESQGLIGLWSGGKRPLLIPQGDDTMMVDLAGIIPFLRSLFFGVREPTGVKGTLFEESVRKTLVDEEICVDFYGVLTWDDGGNREVDMAIKVGDRLVLVECFTFELPVDFEITKPGVFEVRKSRISEKIGQAKSLCESIRANPVGRNFDFTWATSIEWRLVSPFIEFAWDLTDDFFDSSGIARIMSVDELLRFLKDGEAPASELVSSLAQIRAKLIQTGSS